jgi:hypothetical protein
MIRLDACVEVNAHYDQGELWGDRNGYGPSESDSVPLSFY